MFTLNFHSKNKEIISFSVKQSVRNGKRPVYCKKIQASKLRKFRDVLDIVTTSLMLLVIGNNDDYLIN